MKGGYQEWCIKIYEAV